MERFNELIYGRIQSDCDTNKPLELLFYCWALVGIKRRPKGFLANVLMVFIWMAFTHSPFLSVVGLTRLWKSGIMVTEFLTTLQSLINAVCASARSWTILLTLKNLKKALPIFKSLDERCNRPEERQEISDCVSVCARIYVAMAFIFYLYGTICVVSALILHKQSFGGWYPFIDLIANPTANYYVHFICETCYTYFLITAQCLNDLFPIIYMRMIRTHIKLLRGRISRIGEDVEMSDEDKCKQLIDCIATHQQLLEVVDIVRTVCSPIIFIQFSVVAIIDCVCMINFFIFANSITKVITGIYYTIVTMQILPICYEASTLEMENLKLPDSIFHCNWVTLDKRGRKLIVFFIQRAQEDVSFVALQMFKVNLQTYVSIAKFSFTLYTFVNEMGFGEKLKEIMK